MTAAERLAALDDLDGAELCRRTEEVLGALVEVMNAETTLLRGNRYREAGELTARKTQLAQDYVGYARAVQRRLPQLRELGGEALERLHRRHEALTTQMAENLRVLATARSVSESLLADVSTSLAAPTRTTTYAANGALNAPARAGARGIAINRAL